MYDSKIKHRTEKVVPECRPITKNTESSEQYQDSQTKPRIKVQKNLKQKNNQFTIRHGKKKSNVDGYPKDNSSRSTQIITTTDRANDYTDDYAGDDYSFFKVTYEKDSTTITDMSNSGFSFIETGEPSNPKMNRSISYSKRNEQTSLRNVDNVLPFIHKYRRAMQSPSSVSDITPSQKFLI